MVCACACGLDDVASWFHQKPLLLVHDNVPLLGTDVRTIPWTLSC